MDQDTSIRMAVYEHFRQQATAPTVSAIANAVDTSVGQVREAYQRLCGDRLLVLESDQTTIRMAPPFSGVATQHVAEVAGLRYHANCAWDALGIMAALQKPGTVHSRCEETSEALHLPVGVDGPDPSAWIFHCSVPAAQWWDDIAFT